jgi:hypothetical protein
VPVPAPKDDRAALEREQDELPLVVGEVARAADSAGSEAAGIGSDEVGRKVDAYMGATTGFYLTSRRKRHALHSVRQDYGEVVYVFNRGGEGSVLGLVGG